MVIYTFKLTLINKGNMSAIVKKQKRIPILSQGTNAKTIKSDKLGEYLTGIVYLSPHKLSGVNFCGNATDGCIFSCLNLAGMGIFSNVQQGRLRKSHLFINDKDLFFENLIKDIQKLINKCAKLGKLAAIRLNGTSDLPWENIKHNGKTILEYFPQVQFYDYTKNPNRFKNLPNNYHLTFSHSENTTNQQAKTILENGNNIAVVFRKSLPKTFKGFKVINGDNHDLRFVDGSGFIVGLTAKGKAKKDTTGFVIDL